MCRTAAGRFALGLGMVLAVSLMLLGELIAPRASVGGQPVVLSITTSAEDSGLLNVLLPLFEKRTGHTVKLMEVGSGHALALAAKGETDVCLVNAPEAEKRYVADGLLVNRRLVMHDEFLIVGPKEDPAKIRGHRGAAEALKRIAEARATFVSRGGDSGTEQMEKKVWRAAHVEPSGAWYLRTGQGMGATLVIASEKRAYTLTDRGTYLAFSKHVQLVPMVERDRMLLNVYSVLESNARRFPQVNGAGGKALADFLVSGEAQEIIRRFGVEKFGEPLFFPDAGKREEDL
ncbi:MAG TPA: substrate-binding domain-containing protein [Candidatus Methylomirabilis sp.]|nr:substrate-binding domain-containing protein [Candidatus Methylomirabilis sp.]